VFFVTLWWGWCQT